MTSFHDEWEEVDDGDRLTAGRARGSWSDAAAEDAALWTPLLAQIARVARWALVDRQLSGTSYRDRDRSHEMTPAPGGLATRW